MVRSFYDRSVTWRIQYLGMHLTLLWFEVFVNPMGLFDQRIPHALM